MRPVKRAVGARLHNGEKTGLTVPRSNEPACQIGKIVSDHEGGHDPDKHGKDAR
jgi:hypothetical protein